MKILSSQQIREGDAYTIKHEPINSVDLMERAGERCFQWIYDHAPKLFPVNLDEREYSFKVFCGVGNNGGDGLVIARLLRKHGYEVQVFVVEFSDNPSPDFSANLAKAQKSKVPVSVIKKQTDIPEINQQEILVDAFFGTGLSRPVSGITADVIQRMNQSTATIISVDMPSGLFDQSNAENDRAAIIKANYTLTFQFLKLAFMFAGNGDYVGEWKVLDIGLHPDFVNSVESDFQFLTEEWIQRNIFTRSKFSHKGSYGHAAILAGSHGKYGAALLSAKAALRSGAGLVTAHLPQSGTLVMQTAAPEVMVDENSGDKLLQGTPDCSAYKSIGFGPGAGTDKGTASLLKHILSSVECPLVIDADGINILAQHPEWLELLPQNTVLTPHPGELRRLIGDWNDDFDRLQKQMAWAQKYCVFLLCKGAHSAVATPDGTVFFNSTGNAGMATAGSGDVLTGIITGLLAQGYSSLQAVLIGMFLHGRAGDIASEQTGSEALIASDIIDHLGKAFLSVNLRVNPIK